MSLMTHRGGIPYAFRGTITTAAGRKITFPSVANYVQVTSSTQIMKLYFNETDWTNDENYISVPVAAAETPYGRWEGPVEAGAIWLESDTGDSTVEVIAFLRRN